MTDATGTQQAWQGRLLLPLLALPLLLFLLLPLLALVLRVDPLALPTNLVNPQVQQGYTLVKTQTNKQMTLCLLSRLPIAQLFINR